LHRINNEIHFKILAYLTMNPSINLLPIIVLIVIPILFLFTKRKWKRYQPFTPRARWKRITGAVVGIGILCTLTIGTWRAVVTSKMMATDTVVRPTMPPPFVKAKVRGGYGAARVEPCQIILRAYLVRNCTNNPVIVCGKSSVISWPEEAQQTKSFDLSWNGVDCEFSISVHDIYDGGGLISLSGTSQLNVNSSFRSSSSGGGVTYIGKGTVKSQIPSKSNNPLSLWPQISGEMNVWVEAELATKNDPLESITVTDAKLLPSSEVRGSGFHHEVFSGPYQPPGIAMLMHWGSSSLLLLFAAFCGSFAFHRAVPAFAGLLAAGIFYAGGLERFFIYRLDVHARDAQRPLAERVLAVERMTNAFFHPQASTESLNDIAVDAAMPEILRNRARNTELR
jgi:hypothetical protein